MEAMIGTVILFSGGYAPKNWAFCNGDLIPVMENMALYSILGNKFGGDGQNTFALPNLPTVKDIDGKGESQYIVCVNGLYPPYS